MHGGSKNRVKEGKNESKEGAFFLPLVKFRSVLHCLNLIRLGLSSCSNLGSTPKTVDAMSLLIRQPLLFIGL